MLGRRGGGGGGRKGEEGGGSQCGTPEKLASGLCEPPGAPFSITIGSGAMPTSELPSHIEKEGKKYCEGRSTEKKKKKKKDVKSKCVAASARGWH